MYKHILTPFLIKKNIIFQLKIKFMSIYLTQLEELNAANAYMFSKMIKTTLSLTTLVQTNEDWNLNTPLDNLNLLTLNKMQ